MLGRHIGVAKNMLALNEYLYAWATPEGHGDGNSAHANTPIGRIKVSRRRPNVNKWVAWVKGTVIGRDYVDMDSAKRAAEHKVTKLMEKAKAEGAQ
jgi:hypothetical protein